MLLTILFSVPYYKWLGDKNDLNAYIIACGVRAAVLRDMGSDRHDADSDACKELSGRCAGTAETAARKPADVTEARSRLGHTDIVHSRVYRAVRYRRNRRAAKRF